MWIEIFIAATSKEPFIKSVRVLRVWSSANSVSTDFYAYFSLSKPHVGNVVREQFEKFFRVGNYQIFGNSGGEIPKNSKTPEWEISEKLKSLGCGKNTPKTFFACGGLF